MIRVSEALTLRPAHRRDADMIAPLLRDADKTEVLRLGGGTLSQTLRLSVQRSAHAGLWSYQSAPLALFGVVPTSLVGGVAAPWLVGTPELAHCRKPFMYHTRLWVDAWLAQWPVLENFVDACYTSAIRWLKWLGFDVHDPAPHGALGRSFCRFTLERQA